VTDSATPATSQPSVEAFRNVYEDLLRDADGIVSIHISAKLSGTLNSAAVACDELGDGVPIELIDTRTTSCGLGEVARQAAEAANAGATVAEVSEVVRRAMDTVHVMIALDTIEYLRR